MRAPTPTGDGRTRRRGAMPRSFGCADLPLWRCLPVMRGDYLGRFPDPGNVHLPSGANSEPTKMRRPRTGLCLYSESRIKWALPAMRGACILYTVIFDRVACDSHAPKITRRCVPISGD